ncbi:hypothetical protein [Candidatus Kryptobacter tengchongensis]|uniref:hypothetical protein n=1 Tax=Kryptobacter tengchongensis TaxID=1643429 RepID=UPI000707DE26|nr:hypothetical protein [Candidatus Kryptobacter tengchongensis]CUS92522.1 hypothetical protein JGI20_01498 [Candidatus Kryptobacter tengchongensis]
MRVKIQILLIIALIFFNFVLILRHVKILKFVSSLDMDEARMILEENSLVEKYCQEMF